MRYRGRVAAWEVWNEPDNPPYWGGRQSTPQDYLDLLVPAYQAIKAADPDAKVVCGCVILLFFGPKDFTYLEGLLELGVQEYCDAISVHIYPRPVSEGAAELESDMQRVERMVRERGETDIWVTEVGTPSVALAPPHDDRSDQQADLAEVVYRLSRSYRMFWYQLIDAQYHTGVVTTELEPKPSYQRLAESAARGQ